MDLTIASRVTLNDGVEMPWLGLGVWLLGRDGPPARPRLCSLGPDPLAPPAATRRELGGPREDQGIRPGPVDRREQLHRGPPGGAPRVLPGPSVREPGR